MSALTALQARAAMPGTVFRSDMGLTYGVEARGRREEKPPERRSRGLV